MISTVSTVKAAASASNGTASRQFSTIGRRQQHEDEDEGGEVLAKERHPQPPQRVGAGEHDLHLPAGMRAGVVAHRQLQDVLEKIREHQVAAPVRQPVGEPRHHRAGDDDEQAEGDPRADERRKRERCSRCGARQRSGQGVDDAAEQDRLDEQRHRERDIGERKRGGEARLGREQLKHTQINAEKRHDRSDPGLAASVRPKCSPRRLPQLAGLCPDLAP